MHLDCPGTLPLEMASPIQKSCYPSEASAYRGAQPKEQACQIFRLCLHERQHRVFLRVAFRQTSPEAFPTITGIKDSGTKETGCENIQLNAFLPCIIVLVPTAITIISVIFLHSNSFAGIVPAFFGDT